MEKPLVSLVVPAYNVGEYLGKCLESLINQSYEMMEILLVDDGSTDGSGAICDLYAGKDPRVRAIHKENGGPSSARNLGIEHAKGQYLMFVDSDDWAHKDMVRLCVENAAKGVLVSGRLSPVQDDSACEDGENGFLEYDRVRFMTFYCEEDVNSPCAKLYRLDVIKENGIRFPEEITLGEDLLFNLEYLSHGFEKYRVLRSPLYFYRQNRDGSLTNSYRPDLPQIQETSFGAIRAFMEKAGVWDAENREQYFGLYFDRLYLTARIIREYNRQQKDPAALAAFLKTGIWRGIWKNCRAEGAWTIKRQLKYWHLSVLSRACCFRENVVK